jgi:hypothetical protein
MFPDETFCIDNEAFVRICFCNQSLPPPNLWWFKSLGVCCHVWNHYRFQVIECWFEKVTSTWFLPTSSFQSWFLHLYLLWISTILKPDHPVSHPTNVWFQEHDNASDPRT